MEELDLAHFTSSSLRLTRQAAAVCAGVLLLSLICAATCFAAHSPKRVLILDSFGRDVSPFVTAVSSLRTTLAQELGETVDFYEVSLDLGRFSEPETEGPFLEFLRARFQDRPVDLLVPFGGPAVKFIGQYRERLFPGVPIVFTGVDPRLLPPDLSRANATVVTQRINLPGMVEDILQLRPDTTNIVVVLGASRLEDFWVSECRREFQRFTDRVGFTWLNDLSLGQVLEHVAVLPPHSFILFGMFVMDAAGVPFDNDEAFRRLRAVANVPVFAYFGSEFGFGAVGGHLYQDSDVGVRGGRAAIRILRGEAAANIAPQIIEQVTPVYDWRELRHWGISEGHLPAGSVIRFREPTFWALHWRWVIGILLFSLFQTGLIIALLINRAWRRAAETAARDFSGRLIRAHEEERGRLARELHDDVTQRLARLAIDATRVERLPPGPVVSETMSGVRDGLVRLSEDIHALSYRLHPSTLEDLGLVAALDAECERFARQEAIPVEVKLCELPTSVSPETALCLFRIAQEALRNVQRHAKATAVDVSLRRLDGGLQLAVRDDGVGFARAAKSRIIPATVREPPLAKRSGPTEPTPSAGPVAPTRPPDPSAEGFGPQAEASGVRDLRRPQDSHLGLASMQERVQLLGGTIDIDSAPGHGTTILAWVPMKES